MKCVVIARMNTTASGICIVSDLSFGYGMLLIIRTETMANTPVARYCEFMFKYKNSAVNVPAAVTGSPRNTVRFNMLNLTSRSTPQTMYAAESAHAMTWWLALTIA